MPDVVTIGETMLRLSAPPGVPLEQAPQLDVHVAGAESNVAIALCRLGTTAGWISRLVDTPLGRRIVNELRAHGVDVSRVLWAPDGRVGVYFLEQGIPPRQHRIIYDRAQSAMALLNPDDIDWEFVRSTRLVHLTGITPALSAGCRTAASRAIAEARRGKALVCFDVNYRAKLWSADEAKMVLGPLLADVDILIATADDSRLLLSGGGRLSSSRLCWLSGSEPRRWWSPTPVAAQRRRMARWCQRKATKWNRWTGSAPATRLRPGSSTAI